MKILTFSTLFPNNAQPSHGIFVETRLRHLLKSGKVDARVVAPVPWFPFKDDRFGRYAAFARVAGEEQRSGLRVDHPRYPLLPKLGMTSAPALLALAAKPALLRIVRDGYDFDLIDAHYFYPDGVAAALLGRALNKPVVITARGSDLALIPRYRLPRRMIRWAADRAAGLVTVCQALKDVLVELGVSPSRIDVMRNGVDLDFFKPIEREQARTALGLSGRTLLSAGRLIPLKGHDLVIRALALLPDVHLLVAGDGPERASLEALAKQCGVGERVRFLGALSQAALREHYGAADALVLASSREGWANVLLESMACGTPVIASNVGGTAEVVAAPEAGVLMSERTPAALAEAARKLFDAYPPAAATRRYAERFSWDDTTAAQLSLFERILAECRGERGVATALQPASARRERAFSVNRP
jgi:glycosyltransferase involved in cell wall biosynthesis